MPLCQAFKTDHRPCTRQASRNPGDTHPEHLHFCGTHKTPYQRNFFTKAQNTHHTAGRCFHLARVVIAGQRLWQWCPHAAADGQMLCQTHEIHRLELIQAEQARVHARAIVRGLVEALLAEDPPIPWRRAVRILAAADGELNDRHEAAFEYFRHPRTRELEPLDQAWVFREYWRWAWRGQVGPEPAPQVAPPPPAPLPRDGLGALSRDTQNVHTRVVTDQTNAATDKLLKIPVPETQQTEKTLALVWLGGLNVSYSSFLRTAGDINRWFNTKDCRAVGDNLYRRLLRGSVALIAAEKDDERKHEMYRRLWEECHESVGMCCEGHISRLCNVFVGFDEAFQPPVPFGEILQSKMAAIAGMDVSEEEKRKLANAFFDEHKTPAEERAAWLDAF